MAKTLKNVRLLLTSANSTFDHSRSLVEYQIVDGDLSKQGLLVVSGLDEVQNVEDFWDDVITEINTEEGL